MRVDVIVSAQPQVLAFGWTGATIAFGVVVRERYSSERRDHPASDMSRRGSAKLVAEQEAIYAVECQGMIYQLSEALPPVLQSS